MIEFLERFENTAVEHIAREILHLRKSDKVREYVHGVCALWELAERMDIVEEVELFIAFLRKEE